MLKTGEGPSKEPVAAAAEGSVGSPAPAEPVVGTDDAEVAAAIAASKAAYEELQRQQVRFTPFGDACSRLCPFISTLSCLDLCTLSSRTYTPTPPSHTHTRIRQAELFDSELKRAIEASLSEEELRRRAAEREEAEIEHALAQSIALEQV